jgi:hypothetical protein
MQLMMASTIAANTPIQALNPLAVYQHAAASCLPALLLHVCFLQGS